MSADAVLSEEYHFDFKSSDFSNPDMVTAQGAQIRMYRLDQPVRLQFIRSRHTELQEWRVVVKTWS